MMTLNKGIYVFEFPRLNIPLPTHSFGLSENEKGYCNVCGKYCEKSECVVCQKCGIITHFSCSESSYSYCLYKSSEISGFTLNLDEYLAASYTSRQPHLIIESSTNTFICQTCNCEIKGKCYRCSCCDSVFHFDCKPLRDCKSCRTSDPLQHHMLHGATGVCFVCKQPFERKVGFHCCWCGVNVHVKCLGHLPSHCSYGRNAPLITKPHLESNKVVVDAMIDSKEFYWSLLHLNPRQLFSSVEDYKAPIVVHCQSQQDFNGKLHFFTNPNKIVVTKGDLAHTLGWSLPFEEIMSNIPHAVEANCDIWNISELNKEFCCYCGIGIDAFQLSDQQNKNVKIVLEKHVQVFFGDEQLDLQGLCGILLLNVPFYEEARLINQPDALLNDKHIEVIGFTSANHFTSCTTGNLIPKHFGTSQMIKIVVLKHIDFEIDGIPLILYRGIYVVESLRQLQFLAFKN